MARKPIPVLLAAAALVAGCGGSARPGAASSATPSAPPPAAARDLDGVVLDNAGKPFAEAVSVVLDPYRNPRAASAGPDGSFAFKAVPHGPHELQVKLAGQTTYVRRRQAQAVRELTVAIDVPAEVGPLSLGSVYAENGRDSAARIQKDFGGYCDRARAGRPLNLAEEHMPLQLVGSDENVERWSMAKTFAPAELPGAAALCTWIVKREAGTDAQGVATAAEQTWTVALVLRDGKVQRRTFRARPPRDPQGDVASQQQAQLLDESKKWLASLLPSPSPAPPATN